jgi:hypothetical protein
MIAFHVFTGFCGQKDLTDRLRVELKEKDETGDELMAVRITLLFYAVKLKICFSSSMKLLFRSSFVIETFTSELLWQL